MTDYECELAKAEQGEAKAQHNLGVMYRIGHGVPQDYKAALKWFRLAAEQGLAKAQGNLGQMYDEGKGVPRNEETAAKWYRLAADQGNIEAQNNLDWLVSQRELRKNLATWK